MLLTACISMDPKHLNACHTCKFISIPSVTMQLADDLIHAVAVETSRDEVNPAKDFRDALGAPVQALWISRLESGAFEHHVVQVKV